MSWDNVHLLKFCFSFVTLNWLNMLVTKAHLNFEAWWNNFESVSLKNSVMKMNDYLQMDKKDFVMQMFFFHCLSLLSLPYFKGTDDKEICSLLNITGLSSVF